MGKDASQRHKQPRKGDRGNQTQVDQREHADRAAVEKGARDPEGVGQKLDPAHPSPKISDVQQQTGEDQKHAESQGHGHQVGNVLKG
jgi:hypothetical protein